MLAYIWSRPYSFSCELRGRYHEVMEENKSWSSEVYNHWIQRGAEFWIHVLRARLIERGTRVYYLSLECKGRN